MKFNIYKYLLLFLLPAFFSCSQELLYEGAQQKDNNNTSYLGNNEYMLGIQLEGAPVRTRAVDFNQTASIRINQVWIGIFDMQSGKLVSSQSKTLDFRTIFAGTEYPNFLKVGFDEPSETGSGQYIGVCLANYSDVLDEKGNTLESRLEEINYWDDFNEIAVDATTAYSGLHNGIVPVLAGFIYSNPKDSEGQSTDTDETHIKIDQFRTSTTGEVLLSPAYRVDDIVIDTDSNNKYNFTDKLLKLRRLVANINVNIYNDTYDPTLGEEKLVITDVTYKRYNMPTAVYIIERRTTNCTNIEEGGKYTPGSFAPADRPDQSPNWSDMDPVNRYYNDKDWQYGNTNRFTFQHFANKHWSRNTLDNDDPELGPTDREDRTKVGVDADGENKYLFNVLADDPSDFNNFASYFVIKMHIIDKMTGRSLEAEYTIHEGNTSDELGNAKTEGELNDFSVARNIDYTYNVHIAGIDNIYHNVRIGVEEDEEYEHHSGQGGKIWQFYYANDYADIDRTHPAGDDRLQGGAPDSPLNCTYDNFTGSFSNCVPPSGGYYKRAIKIMNNHPDLSFRLYGYTKANDRIDGYNYNFPQESFSYLDRLWPPSAGLTSHYFMNYDELINNGGMIPKELLDGLKIIDPSDDNRERDIVEFIQYMRQQETVEDVTYPRYFDIKIAETNIPRQKSTYQNNYVRAIYLADRNGIQDEVDGCTRIVNIFAAAQYPELEIVEEAVPLEVPYFSAIELNNTYNIIDPWLEDIRVPILRMAGLNQNSYTYRLTIGGKDFSSYGRLDATGNYWVYSIPMNAFPGEGGDIYLQVLSRDTSKYLDSDSAKIGTVTLQNHIAWYNTEPEWSGLLSNYSTKNGGTSEGTYLTIYTDDPAKQFERKSENNVYYLVTDGAKCTIAFKVFKKCQVTVKARTSSSGTARGVTVTSESDGTQNSPLETGTNFKTYTFEISENQSSPDGSNLIKINPNGGGVHFQSIQVSPL